MLCSSGLRICDNSYVAQVAELLQIEQTERLCLHVCRDAPARYAAVRYGAHLESKVLSNFQDEVYGSTADDMLAGVT